MPQHEIYLKSTVYVWRKKEKSVNSTERRLQRRKMELKEALLIFMLILINNWKTTPLSLMTFYMTMINSLGLVKLSLQLLMRTILKDWPDKPLQNVSYFLISFYSFNDCEVNSNFREGSLHFKIKPRKTLFHPLLYFSRI